MAGQMQRAVTLRSREAAQQGRDRGVAAAATSCVDEQGEGCRIPSLRGEEEGAPATFLAAATFLVRDIRPVGQQGGNAVKPARD